MNPPNPTHGGAYLEFPARPEQYRGDAWNDTLSHLFDTAVKHATDRIDWYDDKAAKRATLAKGIRFTSLLLFALGTLAPILLTFLIKISAVSKKTGPPLSWLDSIADWPLAEVGYVFMAVAGALVVFDQFFDASGSWIRFRQSQARLEVLLADFRFGWAQAMAEVNGPVAGKRPAVSFMTILREFVVKIEWLAEDETRQWARRFSQMIDTFDRNPNLKVSLGSTQNGQNTGAAKVDVQNADGSETAAHVSNEGASGLPAASGASGASAVRESAVSATQTDASLPLVNVRLVIDGIESLDPGSLRLVVDDVEIADADDGLAEFRLEAGKDHAIVATGQRAGEAVRGELHENVTIEDEDKPLTIKL
jgi:hypothetical protein